MRLAVNRYAGIVGIPEPSRFSRLPVFSPLFIRAIREIRGFCSSLVRVCPSSVERPLFCGTAALGCPDRAPATQPRAAVPRKMVTPVGTADDADVTDAFTVYPRDPRNPRFLFFVGTTDDADVTDAFTVYPRDPRNPRFLFFVGTADDADDADVTDALTVLSARSAKSAVSVLRWDRG